MNDSVTRTGSTRRYSMPLPLSRLLSLRPSAVIVPAAALARRLLRQCVKRVGCTTHARWRSRSTALRLFSGPMTLTLVGAILDFSWHAADEALRLSWAFGTLDDTPRYRPCARGGGTCFPVLDATMYDTFRQGEPAWSQQGRSVPTRRTFGRESASCERLADPRFPVDCRTTVWPWRSCIWRVEGTWPDALTIAEATG